VHDDPRIYNVLAGMTISSTTAGTTMAATATTGNFEYGHDKHGRGTPKAGLYLHLPICTSIRTLLLLRQKGYKHQLLYSKVTGREASASLPQTYPI
jgi:hypothetical protein